jgi:hypothetical protein
MMSSIFIDEEAGSIRHDSSVSHQVEQFSVTGLSESKSESVSISAYGKPFKQIRSLYFKPSRDLRNPRS